MISLILDRHFRIEVTHPCNLTYILRPHLYNWTQTIDGLVVIDPLTRHRRFNLTRKMLITTANVRQEILQNVSEILNNSRSIDSIWTEDVIYWATNKDYFHQLSNNVFYRKKFKSFGIMTKYNIKLETLFPLLYEILFRPVEVIQQHILQTQSKQIKKRVICAQIRTGTVDSLRSMSEHSSSVPHQVGFEGIVYSIRRSTSLYHSEIQHTV